MVNKITRIIILVLVCSGTVFAQNNRLQGVLTAASTTCTQSPQITSSCITITMPPDAAGVGLQLSGTFSATIQFEGSIDGSNWVSLNGSTVSGGGTASSTAGPGLFQFPAAALVGFRIRVSSYASGAIQAVVQSGIGAPTYTVQNIAGSNVLNTGTAFVQFGQGGNGVPGMDTYGTLYVRTGGPNQFTCYARGVAAALTDFTQVTGPGGCGGVAPAGQKNYITDITVSSTTSTAGSFRISYGTGAACASTNVPIFPANASDTWFYPGNASAPLTISFNQPLFSAAATRLCVFGTATNTLNISINGFLAP